MSKEVLEKHPNELFNDLEKLKRENEILHKKFKKKEKWIEKDEQLANKPRVGRLVTVNDINDPDFKKKYPRARIGDEFLDPEPLRWKLGFKRKPIVEEKHAIVAAQFAHDLRNAAWEDEPLDHDFEDPQFTEAELQSFLDQSEMLDQIHSSSGKQEAIEKSPSGGEATAKQSDEGAPTDQDDQ